MLSTAVRKWQANRMQNGGENNSKTAAVVTDCEVSV
jgi:hypothetical protein